MSGPDVMRHAEAERADLANLLRDLTPQQWQTESRCRGCTVRDVAVHVVSYDELGPATLVTTFLRGGLRVAATSKVAMNRYRDLDTTGVVDLVNRCQHPRGLTAALRGGIALTDGTIHHEDIRRAIDLPRDVPADRLRHVLDFALTAPTLPAKRTPPDSPSPPPTSTGPLGQDRPSPAPEKPSSWPSPAAPTSSLTSPATASTY